jgi:hypothetical protein
VSGAILLLKRWMLALKLRELDLYAHYDYFILTRAGLFVRYITCILTQCMYVYFHICIFSYMNI